MMRWMSIVVVALFSSPASTEPLSYGPPASPVEVQINPRMPSTQSAFVPSADVLGLSQQPVSVRPATLQDSRPYGEVSQRTVWLARYEYIQVSGPAGTTAAVNLTLAFDAPTGHLLCAFTDPAPHWTKSAASSATIEKRTYMDRTIASAHYEELQSSVVEVLAALWKNFGDINPANVGQIVIRPRFIANKWPARRINGEVVSTYAPCNVWLVEVLGTVVLQRAVEDSVRTFTTLVAHFRDGDLRQILGDYIP